MIRVNLSGTPRKQAAKVAAKPASSTNALPLVHLLIVAVAGLGGYLWYSSLNAQSMELTDRIASLQEQQKQLEAVIKQDQVYEARKIALESRIRVIEDLRKNQLSPVVVLDALDEAIDRTRYVWLSSLSQNNATFTMAGTGSSVDALSEFVSNLKATGYFQNINLARFDDSKGNYTFNMTCEFAPPTSAAVKGAN